MCQDAGSFARLKKGQQRLANEHTKSFKSRNKRLALMGELVEVKMGGKKKTVMEQVTIMKR